MAYIGKEPADSFISFAKQDFSTSATTSYTLNNAVTNENELALFINFVRQEPTTAYTASGTTLTLTSATASTDDMYCVYLGQAKQTVNAPDGSVGSSQVSADLITGQTAEATVANDDTVLIHDTSASALRKMTVSNLTANAGVTGISSSADATAITIDSSEQVGIGTTSPDALLELKHATNVRMLFDNTVDSQATIRSIQDSVGHNGMRLEADNIAIRTASGSNTGVERMRMTNDGRLQLGTTSGMPYGGDHVKFGFEFNSSQSSEHYGIEMKDNGSAGTTYGIIFSKSALIGSITYNASSVSYNTSSDYRLKENVSYDFDATTRLKQLKPARFNFIADADKTVDGFLAHEVSSVVPEAITGEKDAINEDGSIQPQGIDQAKLVPLLVKTIQELEARITELENK